MAERPNVRLRTTGSGNRTRVSWLVETWTVLGRAVREARRDGITTTAQALAYSLFLAIPATLLVLLGLFSLLADKHAVTQLVDRTKTIMPSEAALLLQQSLDRATRETGRGVAVTIFGVLLGLWTTTSAATTLMRGITSTYDRRDARGFVRKRLVALGIVAALAVGAALVFGLLVLGPHLARWTGDAIGSRTATTWIWWTAEWPILVVALLFVFAVVLYFGPDVEQRSWQLVTPGAVTALVIWLAVSGAFALYAGKFGSYDKTWGTLSAVVVTLVWLWLASAALLLGAEVNAQTRLRDAERGVSSRTHPNDLVAAPRATGSHARPTGSAAR
jgi:membrane protein